MEQTLNYFEDCLKIIKKARAHAGVTCDNQTLRSGESTRALSWLQTTFEEQFMRNQKIKDKISKLEAVPDLYSRREKSDLRNERRGAFKAWHKDLFGNSPLLHAFFANRHV